MSTPQPVTVEEVANFLNDLARPKTLLDLFRRPSTRVARSLCKLRATGYREEPDSCPIANALKDRFPGHRWLVYGSRIEDGIVVFTPQSVSSFIRRFDNRAFPELNQMLQG